MNRDLVLACGFLAAANLWLGCEPRRVASAADIERICTRQYPGHGSGEIRRAVVTALKLQGYNVVSESPRVRTAPKPIAVHARGGAGHAMAVDETMAWDVDLGDAPGGTEVRLNPRGQIGGQPIVSVFQDFVEQNCGTLFSDIGGSLAPQHQRPTQKK